MGETGKGKQVKDPALIFLHIPKSGGTTLRQIISRQYPKPLSFHANYRPTEKVYEEAKGKLGSDLTKIRLFEGHMFFGLHSFLPQPAKYISMLRNPIERIASQYYFVLQESGNRVSDQVKAEKISLGEYVEREISPETNNDQTRVISGMRGRDEKTSDRNVEIAIKNIENDFLCIGLTERFDEFLLVMNQLYGWKNMYYRKLNRRKVRNLAELSQSTIDIIVARNRWDLELYQYSNQYFDKLVAKIPAFAEKLEQFRLANLRYGRLVSIYDAVKKRFATLPG